MDEPNAFERVDRHGAPTEDDPVEWDKRYGEADRVWSGQPNGTLVAEIEGLAPGQVLDVGCGEGADAVWLAGRGWDVTALDPSKVALRRAAEHARQAGVGVQWVHSGLLDAALQGRAFDLVSAQYPTLRKRPDQAAERALLAAVAPGGTLLVVHHVVDLEHARGHGFDPAEWIGPADVAPLLGSDWSVEFDQARPRHVTSGAGAGHTHDVVLRARRLR